MGLADTYERLRQGIVAFAPRHVEQIRPGARHFEFVFGTGFIVGDSLIATNAHVVEAFDMWPGATADDPAVVAIVFLHTPGGMGSLLLNVKNACAITGVAPSGWYYGSNRPDVGLVSVECKGLASLALTLKSDVILEGTSIATAGFPMGPELMHLEGQLDHIAPTLQSGIISATLPFPCPHPHGYLINVMIQGGASGSPVFLSETGEVIGAVYARRFETTGMTTNFSHVVPTHFIERTISEAGDNLLRSVPSDAPNLAEILASIPTTPVAQITKGTFRHKQ